MYVLGGTSVRHIAEELSKILKEPLLKAEIKRFPDGELYVRLLDNVEGEEVLMIQNTYPDNNIVELFLLQDAANESNAKKINVVIPYYGYGRQDKKFEDGEAISAKALAQLISLKADQVILIDPHKEHILNFFSVPAILCSPIDEIANYLKNKEIDVVLAPDEGALDRAENVAKILGCEYDHLEKKRIDANTITIKTKSLHVKNKNVIILDDIISTGGTMAKAIEELKRQGAKKVISVCTHGLFIGDAIEKLNRAGCDEIVSTDTIKSRYSKIKIASAISRIL
jgi:ribose-phosphate pyrophosphokinase